MKLRFSKEKRGGAAADKKAHSAAGGDNSESDDSVVNFNPSFLSGAISKLEAKGTTVAAKRKKGKMDGVPLAKKQRGLPARESLGTPTLNSRGNKKRLSNAASTSPPPLAKDSPVIIPAVETLPRVELATLLPADLENERNLIIVLRTWRRDLAKAKSSTDKAKPKSKVVKTPQEKEVAFLTKMLLDGDYLLEKKCSVCSMDLRDNNIVLDHMKTHFAKVEEEPKCMLDKGKKPLELVKIMASGVRVYKVGTPCACQYCERIFAFQSGKSRHERKTCPERPDDLKPAPGKRIPTREATFECRLMKKTVCNSGPYVDKSSLDRHMRNHHRVFHESWKNANKERAKNQEN